MKLLIKSLTYFFLFLIIYSNLFNSVIEGLTQSEAAKETAIKITKIEKNVETLQKVNPLAPCEDILPTVESNSSSIQSMKDQIDDLKANCSRQEDAS